MKEKWRNPELVHDTTSEGVRGACYCSQRRKATVSVSAMLRFCASLCTYMTWLGEGESLYTGLSCLVH